MASLGLLVSSCVVVFPFPLYCVAALSVLSCISVRMVDAWILFLVRVVSRGVDVEKVETYSLVPS